MADRIGTKSHYAKNSLQFGMPFEKDLFVTSLAANQANTTLAPAAVFTTTMAIKIPLVTLIVSSATSGVTAFNIVLGNAAEAGVLVPSNADVQFPPTTNSTPGLSLFMAGTQGNFSGPQDYTTIPSTAYGTAVIPTSEPDAIFPQGTVFTLRYVSGATVNGNLRVSCLCIPQDLYPSYALPWTWGPTNIG